MNPSYTLTMIQDWINAESAKKHSMAVKYIEENVDLIDTDLQKFMDDCPSSCRTEVYEMLLKAGIDMKDYVFNGVLKQWINYISDANQYYTIDYKKELEEHIDKIVTWKTDVKSDWVVLDAIPAVKEA